MVKRAKKIEKGIESLKREIDEHFEKLKKDIEEGNMERGRYHAKEIEKSLIGSLELKINILCIKDDSARRYREKLNKLKEEFGLQDF